MIYEKITATKSGHLWRLATQKKNTKPKFKAVINKL